MEEREIKLNFTMSENKFDPCTVVRSIFVYVHETRRIMDLKHMLNKKSKHVEQKYVFTPLSIDLLYNKYLLYKKNCLKLHRYGWIILSS